MKLTRDQIEEIRERYGRRGMVYMSDDINSLCDMALLAVSPEEAPRNAVIDECANILDALYSQGPQRGTVGWGQAWGCGVLDAADAVRALKQSLPQRVCDE